MVADELIEALKTLKSLDRQIELCDLSDTQILAVPGGGRADTDSVELIVDASDVAMLLRQRRNDLSARIRTAKLRI